MRTLNSQLVHDGFGREIENWTCWEGVTEYTTPDTTQLDSTCSVWTVYTFSTKSVGSRRRELVVNSIHTAPRRRDSLDRPSRVGGVYSVLGNLTLFWSYSSCGSVRSCTGKILPTLANTALLINMSNDDCRPNLWCLQVRSSISRSFRHGGLT